MGWAGYHFKEGGEGGREEGHLYKMALGGEVGMDYYN